jgi:hypothetical protein
MKRYAALAGLLCLVASPAFCKTHKENYSVSCTVLWPAVKDVLRNSGKYGILGIDNGEMTASYVIGGTLTGKRINSVVLNGKGDACELQIQTAYSGLGNNDEGDFKKRVDTSLAKLQAAPPAATPPAAAPDPAATKPATAPPATAPPPATTTPPPAATGRH